MRAEGLLLSYGLATWDCFRQAPGGSTYLSLEQVVAAAEEVGGPGHGFRFVQLPINAAMTEAWSKKWQVGGWWGGGGCVALLLCRVCDCVWLCVICGRGGCLALMMMMLSVWCRRGDLWH
jgi:hypothetical protein